MPSPIHNRQYLLDRRKTLRRQLTPAEARLWEILKNSKFHQRKFRRQHSVENYIIDFYCIAERLGIELDGEAHHNPGTAAYDAERDARLRELNITMLRFENRLVFEHIEYVLSSIEAAFVR